MPPWQHGAHDFEAQREKSERDPTVKPTWKERIMHFTWPWFSCNMSTGALANVIGNSPDTFPGLMTIGKIFFITDLVLFIFFNILIGLRFYWRPRALYKSFHHPVEGLFIGAYWVSVALIISNAQIYGVSSCGPWLVTALRVCFWLYVGIVLLLGTVQYTLFFTKERLATEQAMPAWIFPIYPLLVVGNTAGSLIPSQPANAAWAMWIGAVMLQGLSWTVSLLMYAIFTQRFLSAAMPAPSSRPGMYVSVGPAGYTSASLILLGRLAPSVLPTGMITSSSMPQGAIAEVIGVLSGIFLLMFSGWFFFTSTLCVVLGLKQTSFTLNWWAFIFPNAGLTLAVIEMGKVLKSAAIDGICSALTILMVAFWLFVAGAHVWAVWTGRILWPGKDEDRDLDA